MQIGTTKTTILIWYADESGSDWVKPFTWVIVSDDLHPNIFDHSGHLHWEIIFWGVVFGVDNIFVIFKIKIFGEVWLIITLDSLIPILTSPPPEVFIETQKSAFKCFGSLSFAPTFSPHSGQITCILVFSCPSSSRPTLVTYSLTHVYVIVLDSKPSRPNPTLAKLMGIMRKLMFITLFLLCGSDTEVRKCLWGC